jgi:hypothetical protein
VQTCYPVGLHEFLQRVLYDPTRRSVT